MGATATKENPTGSCLVDMPDRVANVYRFRQLLSLCATLNTAFVPENTLAPFPRQSAVLSHPGLRDLHNVRMSAYRDVAGLATASQQTRNPYLIAGRARCSSEQSDKQQDQNFCPSQIKLGGNSPVGTAVPGPSLG